MKRTLPVTAIAVFLPAIIFCNSQLSGGGTETTNGISGIVAAGQGLGEKNADVVAAIYSIDYRPDSGTGLAETASVNIDGKFHFKPPSGGRYNLFIRDTVGRMGAFVPMLPADTALGIIELTPTVTLLTTAKMGASDTRYELLIPGTPFYCLFKTGEAAAIPNVPAGAYTIRLRDLRSYPDSEVPGMSVKSIIIDSHTSPDTVRITVP